jgi:membrane protein YqaA with SNARE-associated domain
VICDLKWPATCTLVGEMTGFFQSLFQFFLSPLGLVALSALDSSMLFFLPIAVEAAVVILSARHPQMFWAFPFLATAGSLIGSSVTFWMGRKIGESSLEHWVSARRLDKVRCRIKDKGAIALAIPALLPPPFPLTPFVLACGALEVSRNRFFVTLGALRLVRFGIVGILGRLYGRQVLAVLDSSVFKGIVVGFLVLAVAGTSYTIYRLVVSTRSHRRVVVAD